MPDAEPIVCRVFKLPPEQELFFTLKARLEEITQKLDHLNLVIVAYSETHPCSEAIQLLHNTRAAAAATAETVHTLTLGLNEVAKLYIKLVNELSPTSAPSGEQPLDFQAVTDNVEMVIEDLEKGSKEMTQFTEVATEAVGKISSLLGAEKSENILLTPENAEVVNDLIRAAKKSASAFQNSENYFRELNQHVSEVVDKAKASPPLVREAEMVHQRWSDFRDDSVKLVMEVADIHTSLERDPYMYTEDTVPLGATVEVAGTSSAPASADPKPPSRSKLLMSARIGSVRSLLKRIFSCITLHHFD